MTITPTDVVLHGGSLIQVLLFRFDCDLSLDVHDANFKQPNARFAADHEHLINNKLISIHKVLNIFVFIFKSIKN